jgi:hypothetical protein
MVEAAGNQTFHDLLAIRATLLVNGPSQLDQTLTLSLVDTVLNVKHFRAFLKIRFRAFWSATRIGID